MALKIQLRKGTASTWTSTNPILAQGEPGAETDTGKFKIGDGSTVWNSLSYQGATGPSQTKPFRNLGDGSDGNVTISSGITTLTRDMYYNNLTINGTGKLITNGCKVFIKDTLNLSSAPAGAIQWNGNVGNNASSATGGAAQSAQLGYTLGDIMLGGTGSTATTGTGTNGSAGALTTGNGGIGGAGGRGGSGVSGNPAAATNSRNPQNESNVRTFRTNLLFGNILFSGGAGGAQGSVGSGDSFFSIVGGGSGSGGNGGGVVAVYTNKVVTSATTAASCIQALGGNGGNGGNGGATLGGTGGGGAGGGGGGGWIYFCYNYKFGPTISNFFDASGGVGGTGGNGYGSGTGGNGGDAGNGGRITVLNIPNNNTKFSLGIASNILAPEQAQTVSFNTFLKGGIGGFNGYSKLDF